MDSKFIIHKWFYLGHKAVYLSPNIYLTATMCQALKQMMTNKIDKVPALQAFHLWVKEKKKISVISAMEKKHKKEDLS